MGVSLLIENPRMGGVSRGGAEGPGGCLQRIGEFLGGGPFFWGAEMSTKFSSCQMFWSKSVAVSQEKTQERSRMRAN